MNKGRPCWNKHWEYRKVTSNQAPSWQTQEVTDLHDAQQADATTELSQRTTELTYRGSKLCLGVGSTKHIPEATPAFPESFSGAFAVGNA